MKVLPYAVICGNRVEYDSVMQKLVDAGFLARRKSEPQRLVDSYEVVDTRAHGSHFNVCFNKGTATYSRCDHPIGYTEISGANFLQLFNNNAIKAICRKGWN